MSISLENGIAAEIDYPDSDGQPMSDNTKQFRWIVTIEGGLELLYAGDPNVFVAGDLLWYPVEGNPKIRAAPDAMVVFGRPKGDRGSYRQWMEDSIAPQVVFEVLSPGNRPDEMLDKLAFYERYGVEEYYVYDPDNGELEGWLRSHGRLQRVESMSGWISPRLRVRFELAVEDLVLFRPNGQRFLSFIEMDQRAEQAEASAEQALASAEQAHADAEQARQRAAHAEQNMALLLQQLRAAGIEPNLPESKGANP